MFLKAAINGGRTREENAGVPVTVEEVARDSSDAFTSGADVVHAHARTADGEQTIHPTDIGAMVRAVRAANPQVIIGTTTGLWTCSGHEERMRLVEAWPEDALPDFASVAYSEKGAAETAELILKKGMVLESAVWSMDDVPALLASSTLHQNVRILIEPEDEDPEVAVAACRTMAEHLRKHGVTAPLLYHGYDQTTWPVIQAAIEDGVETRIGYEDVLLMPNGEPAVDNAAMIKATLAMALERSRN